MSDASNPSQSGLPAGAQALPEALGGAPAAPAPPSAAEVPKPEAKPAPLPTAAAEAIATETVE